MPRISLSMFLLCTLTPGLLHAQTIIDPTGISTSGAVSVSGNLNDTINQSGLSSPYRSGATLFDGYVGATTHAGGNGGGYTPVLGQPTFNFSLDRVRTIDGAALWSNNSATTVKSYSLYSYADASFSGSGTRIGTADFMGNDASNAHAAIATFAPIDTQYIQLRDTGTLRVASASSIGEIAFRQAAPEPATWSLMILGFGVVGSTLRRQRRQWIGAIVTA